MHYLRRTSCLMFANLKKIERQGGLGKHVELYCIYCKRNGVALPFARSQRAWCRCYLGIKTMFPSSKKRSWRAFQDIWFEDSQFWAHKKHVHGQQIELTQKVRFEANLHGELACFLTWKAEPKLCADIFFWKWSKLSSMRGSWIYSIGFAPTESETDHQSRTNNGGSILDNSFLPFFFPRLFSSRSLFFVWQRRRPTSSPGRHIDFFQKSLSSGLQTVGVHVFLSPKSVEKQEQLIAVCVWIGLWRLHSWSTLKQSWQETILYAVLVSLSIRGCSTVCTTRGNNTTKHFHRPHFLLKGPLYTYIHVTMRWRAFVPCLTNN